MKNKYIAAVLLLAASQAQGIEFKPEARAYLDYAAYRNDNLSLKDTVLIRSARLGAKIDFLSDWRISASYDLADAIADKHTSADVHNFKAGIKNISLAYRRWRYANISIGQYKLPFSLEQSMGSSVSPFMESSLASQVFSPSRRLAVGVDGYHQGFSYSANLFDRSIDGRYTGNGLIARTTYAFKPKGSLLHFGAAFKHDNIRDREDKSSDFDAYPEVKVAPQKYVNTGHIKRAETRQDVNLEAAWQYGALILQTEATHSRVVREKDPDLDFFGWYAGLSWFLNGESYLKYRRGRFGNVERLYDGGVWQMTARYSYVDLNSKNVRGGEQENFTIGLNYFFNKNYRLMMNVIKVRSNRRGELHSPVIGALRLQVDY